jgi:hypothetical protein
MTSKKRARPADTFPRKAIPVHLTSNDDEEKGLAHASMMTAPEVAAARVMRAVAPTGLSENIDMPTLLATLRDHAGAAQRGDMARSEAMLMNQAEALEALFTRLVERGMEQALMPNIEGFMRLALRAQSQCRATLEALAAIKNPQVIYARQANIAAGPQQVNNVVERDAGARENQIRPTQLLESLDGGRLVGRGIDVSNSGVPLASRS